MTDTLKLKYVMKSTMRLIYNMNGGDVYCDIMTN